MQMAKTTAAANRLNEAGLPFITVLANPATGQAYGSFANLADIILAEPGAIVGFSSLQSHRTGQRPAPAQRLPHRRVPHGARDARRRSVQRTETAGHASACSWICLLRRTGCPAWTKSATDTKSKDSQHRPRSSLGFRPDGAGDQSRDRPSSDYLSRASFQPVHRASRRPRLWRRPDRHIRTGAASPARRSRWSPSRESRTSNGQ